VHIGLIASGLLLVALPILGIAWIIKEEGRKEPKMVLNQQKLQAAKSFLVSIGVMKEEDNIEKGISALKDLDLDNPSLKDSILDKCKKMGLTDSDAQITYDNTLRLLKELKSR
jgi:hypothetical protein